MDLSIFLNSDLFATLLLAFLGVLVPPIVAVLVKWGKFLRTAWQTNIDEEIRRFAADAVRWIEEQDITRRLFVKGYEKTKEAAKYLNSQIFKRYGIRLDQDELENAVIVALREIRDEFGDEWGKGNTVDKVGGTD